MKIKIFIFSLVGISVISTGVYFIKKTNDVRKAEMLVLQSYQEKKDIKRDRKVDPLQDIKKAAEYKKRLQSFGIEIEDSNKKYSKNEVLLHSSKTSCCVIINRDVYDLTTFASIHPGGEENILQSCGRDVTSLFDKEHGGESVPEKFLENYKIGTLE